RIFLTASWPSIALFRPAEPQQKAANYDCPNAGPDGDVDVLLFTKRQMQRTDVCLVGGLGMATAAISQAQHAGHDQYGRRQFVCIHLDCSAIAGATCRFRTVQPTR